MKHANMLWCNMYIVWYTKTVAHSHQGVRGLITVVNYRKIFHKYCQELVKATMFQYYNKLYTEVDYCVLKVYIHTSINDGTTRHSVKFNVLLLLPRRKNQRYALNTRHGTRSWMDVLGKWKICWPIVGIDPRPSRP